MKTARFLTALLLVAGLAFAQTTVNYYSFTTDQDRIDELAALVAEFEAQHPDIRIRTTTATSSGWRATRSSGRRCALPRRLRPAGAGGRPRGGRGPPWPRSRAVGVPPSTLPSAAAGLRAAADLLDPRYAAAAAAWRFTLERCVVDGRFVKSVRNPAADASLVWLATPLGMVDDADPTFARTLARVERDLLRPDGLLRFRFDTFYGGGAWMLLTAGLAWHHGRAGRVERATELLALVERHRAPDGGLPEQVPTEGTDPWFLDDGTRHWGPVASPLLGSHAMVVLARSALAELA